MEKQENEAVAEDGEAVESVTTATLKIGKNKGAKEIVQSTLNAVNRSTLQIKKPHRRNSSPLNWFPRKKTDSYLERKIRLLQEVGGMNSTLDETLGDSNPHYSRVLREKIAAREAAQKAMEARKAALVEASWCRILRAARIQSKEAESLLLKAEKSVAEAFEAAAAMGVVMYDRPDCPRKPCEIETSSVNLGGSTTHTVTASFETAFEVDKEVAAAVKNAFILLANCPSSSNKDEFRDLLWRISQNPDMNESNQELSSECSGCELDTVSELESESLGYGSTSCHLNLKTPQTEMREGKCKNGRHPNVKSTKLVDMMLERLKCLHEDELSSLATIVATCGLNAALLEVENSKQHDHLASGVAYTMHPPISSTGNSSSLKTGRLSHFDVPEVPSLDKFLVKHVSRLEREVQEAKNRRKNEVKEEFKEKPEGSITNRLCDPNNHDTSSDVPDLGSILVKHASKLEKEIEVAKKTTLGKSFGKECKQSGETKDYAVLPSLDKFFVKHVSRLEREVEEAKKARKNNSEGVEENPAREMKQKPQEGSEESQEGSESKLDKNSYFNSCNAVSGLGSILIKHSSKLEKEIAEEKKKKLGNASEYYKSVHKKDVSEVPSLDKCLVKHVSRLEREVQEAKMTRMIGQLESRKASNSSGILPASSSMEDRNLNAMNNDSFIGGKQVGKENIDLMNSGALGEGTLKDEQTDNENANMEALKAFSVPKNMSRIERAKLEARKAFSVQDGKEESDCGLDRILIKQVHRLEREKKMQALEGYGGVHVLQRHGRMDGSDCESLDKVLVKHQSRLEKEKLQSGYDQMKPSDTRQKAREKELQEAWGGLSLGNSIRPHLSRLERDKAAWMEAEEEEQRQAAAAIKEI